MISDRLLIYNWGILIYLKCASNTGVGMAKNSHGYIQRIK
jgi:hypothetical protein